MNNTTLKYIGSSGNEYDLKSTGLRTRSANYHSWSWGVNGTTLQYGTRVSNFTRTPLVYQTELNLFGSPQAREDIVEALHEDFERDVRFMTPGRIVWGNWYIPCYITASSTEPGYHNAWTNNEVTIWCPRPFWVKENTRSFSALSAPTGPDSPIVGTGQAGYMTLGGGGAQTFLDYPYDFEYDFYHDLSDGEIWPRTFPFESDFKMIIFGAVANPRIVINNHPYQIIDTLGASEYVIIDSRTNTITKTLAGGTVVNEFDFRDKVNSVFKKIPGGSLNINWSGLFGFDLTLYEERSEPLWN